MNKRHKIVAGLKDAISYAKGNPAQVRVTVKNVPESIDVRSLRQRLGMSQPEFALRFGFSIGTLRQWEQGRRYPDGPARVLLTVIDQAPDIVKAALETVEAERSSVRRAERKCAVG